MRNCLFLFLTFFSVSYQSIAQNATLQEKEKLPSFVPSSPNVSALGKFGEIPVGLYTGIADITIPIYTINVSDFSLPINLSYHPSGVKPNEYASSSGLGWAISAGGVISKSQRGLDDEAASGFLFNNSEAAKQTNRFTKNEMTTVEKSYFQLNVSRGTVDSEPDIYSYNVCGMMGKFMIDSNYNVVPIPYSDSKIFKVNGDFVIVDTKGNKYFFADREQTTSTSYFSSDGGSVGNSDPINSFSWYLSKIKLYNGEEILFSYTTSTINPQYQISESKYFRQAIVLDCNGNLPFDNLMTYKTWNQSYIVQKKISQIQFPNGKVQFYYSPSEREDLHGDFALTGIDVFSGKPNNYENIKSFNFDFNYYSNRLFLTGISEGVGSSPKKTHTFSYTNPNELPGPDTKAIDYWGFYNGASNSTLIPKTNQSPAFMDGGDREANPSVMEYGILNKIIYPTKGYTVFKYEPHDYGNIKGYEDVSDNIYTLAYEGSTLNVPLVTAPITQQFTIDYEQEVDILSTINGWGIYVKLLGPDGGYLYGHTDQMGMIDKSAKLILQPGTYTLTGYNYESDFICKIGVVYKRRTLLETKKFKLAGGLRIRAIENFNNDDTLVNSKTFRYRLNSDPERSSGLLVNKFFNEYFKDVTKLVGCDIDRRGLPTYFSYTACSYLVRQSYSNLPLTLQNGSHVVYSEVEVMEGSEGQNGKTLSEFITIREFGDLVFESFPFGLGVSNDYLRGQLKKKTEYGVKNNVFVKKHVQKNSYENVGDAYSGMPGAVIGGVLEYEDTNLNTYASQYYRLITQKVNLISTVDTLFTDNSYIATNKIFEYGNFHNFLVKETVSTSNSSILINHYRYPFEIKDSPPILFPSDFNQAIDTLISKNRIDKPIERLVYDNSNFLMGEITSYRNWYLGNRILALPNQIMSRYLHFPYVAKNNFYHFDNFANPDEVNQELGARIVYLYSYGSQYPIAEIKNTSYSTVESLLGGAASVNSFSSSNPTDSQVNTFVNSLRNSPLLKDAFITSYTYKPLVGMTSMTDPKGLTTFYDYDSFGRLQFIRDQDGNIIKQMDYHYKN